jgi:pimeloyl-ACP methyl ester carboxylesterase
VNATRPFRLELDDGHFVVGDELPGERPAYLYLHGLGAVRTGEKSALLFEHAARLGRTALRLDLRGHGESSGKLGQVKVSGVIDDVIRVLERIGPADIVGSSLGGLVSAYAAVRRPDLVRRLALLAPAIGLLPDLGKRLDHRGRMWTSEGQAFFVLPEVLADAHALDESSLASRLQVPTLVVHGTADDVIPPAAGERFFAAIPHAQKQFWLVPGGDHRLSAVAAEIFARLDALAPA